MENILPFRMSNRTGVDLFAICNDDHHMGKPNLIIYANERKQWIFPFACVKHREDANAKNNQNS